MSVVQNFFYIVSNQRLILLAFLFFIYSHQSHSQIGFGNLQFPENATINELGSINVFGRVFKSGVTNAPGRGVGIIAELGYSSENTNPNTWTNWNTTFYNLDVGNDDEYMGVLANLLPGTYYYTFRYSDDNGANYYYGGFNGGEWNTATNVSGVLTITSIMTLTPDFLCEGSSYEMTAGGASSYEFLVDNISQTGILSNNTYTTPILTDSQTLCARGYPTESPIIDGNISETFWGTALANSSGGPSSGFGDNRLNSIHVVRRNGFVHIAISGRLDMAGDNKILIFFDTEDAGFNSLSAWTNRDGVGFFSAENLNSGIQFDAGFNPDRMLIIGVDGNNINSNERFLDFYNMVTNAPREFLGSNLSQPLNFAYQQNNNATDYTKGFEIRLPFNLFGTNAQHKLFVMLVNSPTEFDGTLLSNQFLSPASGSDGNYGSGNVNFNSATPNPINYRILANPYAEKCLEVNPKPITTQITH
uniref:hypothetical protein n=1 Tax=Flavobacterium sp. TaxID=239 RepID=UPI00404B5C41